MAESAIVDGVTVKIGDRVGFKSDVEQSGTITAIDRKTEGVILTLEAPGRFAGEYIGGDLVTTVNARDCFI